MPQITQLGPITFLLKNSTYTIFYTYSKFIIETQLSGFMIKKIKLINIIEYNKGLKGIMFP